MLKRFPVVAAIAAAAVLTAAPASAGPVKPLPCTASVSNPRPQQYTTEYVSVDTLAGNTTQVTTVADYRTTRTVRYATDPEPASGHQVYAVTSYRISDATPGYRVLVQVYVKAGTRSGYCTTSFTPQRRPVVPPPPTVTVTGNLSVMAYEPTDLYAHVTTTGRPGSVMLSENIYCHGILQESGDLPSTTGRHTTPAEFAVTPVPLENGGTTVPGDACTVDLSAATTGQDMGTVRLTATYGP